jgi:hypothetical protein
MVAASSFGVIFYVALHTGQPCDLAFRDMAKAAGFKTVERSEEILMQEFALAACQTTNPDILWQLAYQESSFRFEIATENVGVGMANIYQGTAAVRFLKNLGPHERNRNIDIGVMQYNWAWHNQGFQGDALRALSPREQVRHFLKSFSGEIFVRCQGRWVGCYHSSNDKNRAQKYERDVVEKGRILRLHALRYLRQVRGDMPQPARQTLPPIMQDDIDKLIAFARGVPIPLARK